MAGTFQVNKANHKTRLSHFKRAFLSSAVSKIHAVKKTIKKDSRRSGHRRHRRLTEKRHEMRLKFRREVFTKRNYFLILLKSVIRRASALSLSH
jgi:hypothetical protein